MGWRSKYSWLLSRRAQRVSKSPTRSAAALVEGATDLISFAAGEPDPDVLPRELFADLASELFRGVGQILNYTSAEGLKELRAHVAKHMEEYEGVRTNQQRIVITVGGSEALDLLSKALIDEGDFVIVENPTYVNALLLFRQYGARIVGVPIDNDGLVVDELEERLRAMSRLGVKPKFLYTMPTGHNPAGVTMNEERRKRLIELAEEYDFLIVEDGAYNRLYYGEGRPTSLRALGGDRVVFVGTFSKVLGTGLRVGWIEANEELADLVGSMKGPADMCAPTPSQYMVLEVLKRGLFGEIAKRAVEAYRARRNAMVKALDEELPDYEFTRPNAGMFVMLWLRKGLGAQEVAEKLVREARVVAVPATGFFVERPEKDALRLNFSRVPEDRIFEGIRRIKKVLKGG
ncbi:MAG: PLP-dependent aminotransferase family protein [Desulfurococcaceae archaeon]